MAEITTTPIPADALTTMRERGAGMARAALAAAIARGDDWFPENDGACSPEWTRIVREVTGLTYDAVSDTDCWELEDAMGEGWHTVVPVDIDLHYSTPAEYARALALAGPEGL